MASSENKTQPNAHSVDDFITSIGGDTKRADSAMLMQMMREISGQNPVMWGSSIIGFGSQHYKYETGREGDMPIIGFSPRKAAITVYITEGFNDYGDLLPRLGKYTNSVSCLYIKKLADIDVAVLREIIKRSYDYASIDHRSAPSLERYVLSAPEPQRYMLQQIRGRVHELIPEVAETISYQIPAFKLNGRILLFMAAWKDHISIYPIPNVDDALRAELLPFVKGKGTLWFDVKKPLPQELIDRLIIAHLEAYQLRRASRKREK